MDAIAGLYTIADIETMRRHGVDLPAFAEDLRAAEAGTVQLRYKSGSPREILEAAAVLRKVFSGTDTLLILNDRLDLALLAGFGGVHVGQDDLAPSDLQLALVRGGHTPPFVVGLSTHTDEQLRRADTSDADYLAIGPVFTTGTKADAAPVVGLDGVRRARALTRKPLVAIGGITAENAAAVRAAGADAVAIISGLFVPGQTVEQTARDFLAVFR